MALLGLAGRWDHVPLTLVELLGDGYSLTRVGEHDGEEGSPALLLVVLGVGMSTEEAAALSQRHGPPWLAWDREADAGRMAAAYRDGALAVVPGDPSRGHLLEAIRTTLALVLDTTAPSPASVRRLHRRGQIIPRPEGTVLELEDGIVAIRALHPDGSEVLLELCGPGQLVVSHPTDQCYVETVAHTDVTAVSRRWRDVARDPALVDRLREQLVEREAWAAMQARPHLEQKLSGILSLLAGRFGMCHPGGVLIDVHVTHAMLASATGATRPTVSRLLTKLVRAGRLATAGSGPRARFALPGYEPADVWNAV